MNKEDTADIVDFIVEYFKGIGHEIPQEEIVRMRKITDEEVLAAEMANQMVRHVLKEVVLGPLVDAIVNGTSPLRGIVEPQGLLAGKRIRRDLH
jgi:hypothetical protein